jgi:hypothetical protein
VQAARLALFCTASRVGPKPLAGHSNLKDIPMKTTPRLALLSAAVLSLTALTACQKTEAPPPPPAVVLVPGPAGASGATGATGETGAMGATGSGGSTVIVVPAPASAASN